MQAAFDDRSPQDFHTPVLERGGRDVEGIERRHQFSPIHPSGEAELRFAVERVNPGRSARLNS
jgi:hypothetical protein